MNNDIKLSEIIKKLHELAGIAKRDVSFKIYQDGQWSIAYEPVKPDREIDYGETNEGLKDFLEGMS